MANVAWTKEMDDLLSQKASEGLSSSKIVEFLNKQFNNEKKFTRNSVIGRAHRMNVPLTAKKVEPPKNLVFNKPVKQNIKVIKVNPVLEQFVCEESNLGRSILQLRHNECRFTNSSGNPSQFIFCAKPTEIGRSYCDDHHQIVYIKRELRKKSA